MISSYLKVEFVCPKCQGRHWKEDLPATSGECTRQACGFKWSRSEDWKVFAVVAVARFSSDSEYREASSSKGNVTVVVSRKAA